jgi:hypothetical protein
MALRDVVHADAGLDFGYLSGSSLQANVTASSPVGQILTPSSPSAAI